MNSKPQIEPQQNILIKIKLSWIIGLIFLLWMVGSFSYELGKQSVLTKMDPSPSPYVLPTSNFFPTVDPQNERYCQVDNDCTFYKSNDCCGVVSINKSHYDRKKDVPQTCERVCPSFKSVCSGNYCLIKLENESTLSNSEYICAIPCMGAAPDEGATQDCAKITTENECNNYTSNKFPSNCQWRKKDYQCPLYP